MHTTDAMDATLHDNNDTDEVPGREWVTEHYGRLQNAFKLATEKLEKEAIKGHDRHNFGTKGPQLKSWYQGLHSKPCPWTAQDSRSLESKTLQSHRSNQ